MTPQSAPPTLPWQPLVLCGLLYGSVGLVLASFGVALWVWGLALGATVLQTLALAGKGSLQRFRWFTTQLIALFNIVGAAGLAASLSIALNHAGAADLAGLTIETIIWDVVTFSLMAVGLAACCSLVVAATGDRLLTKVHQGRASIALMAVCLAGLGVGAAVGLGIA